MKRRDPVTRAKRAIEIVTRGLDRARRGEAPSRGGLALHLVERDVDGDIGTEACHVVAPGLDVAEHHCLGGASGTRRSIERPRLRWPRTPVE